MRGNISHASLHRPEQSLSHENNARICQLCYILRMYACPCVRACFIYKQSILTSKINVPRNSARPSRSRLFRIFNLAQKSGIVTSFSQIMIKPTVKLGQVCWICMLEYHICKQTGNLSMGLLPVCYQRSVLSGRQTHVCYLLISHTKQAVYIT